MSVRQSLQQHQSLHQRSHSRNNSFYDVIIQQERNALPSMNHHMAAIPRPEAASKDKTEYSSYEQELYLYLTNPANSGEYEAAYRELLQEVTDSQISRYFSTGDKPFVAPKLTCGATGEEFEEWRDTFMGIIGPLAKAMTRMSGEDEEAQDDQLELIDKVLADVDRPEYGAYLKQQGTYKYVCLVRDYNAQILQLISDNVSNALYNLFCTTRSAVVAYNFIKTRFNAKIWTKAIYSMATIPTQPSKHLEQFHVLRNGVSSARLVQPCEVPAIEFSFILEFLRSRRDVRDHPEVTDAYHRLLSLYQNEQSMKSLEVDALLVKIEYAVREILHEEITESAASVGTPMSPLGQTSFEMLTKKVRSRGRRRRSALPKAREQ